MNNHKKTRKGFTLIELLTVMAVLALLSVVILVSLNNARVKARDARRKTEMRQIYTAMLMYFDTNNTYPIYSANDVCSITVGACSSLLYPTSIGTFLVSMPKDPTNNTTYYYRIKANTSSTFCVIATIEQDGTAFYASQKGVGASSGLVCP